MRRAVVAVVCGAVLMAGAAIALGVAPLPESGSYDLETDAATVMSGVERADQAGWAVARAGDVNGDGRADLIVGAPQADPGGRTEAGSAYVVFGPATLADVDLENLGDNGFRIDGAVAGDKAGWAVAGLGDVNGDLLADVVVGAPLFDRPDGEDSGAAYIVFGKDKPAAVDLASLSPEAGRRVTGASADERAGFSVGRAGDLDGDQRGELLVGAPLAGPEGSRLEGSAFVVFSGALAADVDLGALGNGGYRLDGVAGSVAGVAVAGIPDLNADKLPEIAVGAPFMAADEGRPGGVFVSWGKASAETVELGSLGAGGFVINGGITAEVPRGEDPPEDLRTAAGWAGVAVAPAPDLNGDGKAEILVGAPTTSPKQRRDAGSAYVVYGKSTSDEVDLSQLGASGVRIDGTGAGDWAGLAVGAAGDFDDDGTQDILVGAPLADPLSREDAGAGYVIFGSGLTGDVDLAGLADRGVRIAGVSPGAYTGFAFTWAGDLTGDGVGDLALGAPHGLAEREGAAYLLAGPKEEPPPPGETPPPPDPGVQEEVEIDKCLASRNVEVVVDDSGSMEDTDPERLRAEAIEVMISKERNAEEVLGAVEFGTDAAQLFPPTRIDPFGPKNNRGDLREALRRLQADDGGTNYNAAFAVLADENPGATARIFITDGAHNEGEYRELHRGGPRTFVIGFGIGRKGRDGQRLARIAEETGGRYFANVKRHNLQRAINAIDSRLNCDIELDFIEDEFEEQGDVEVDDVELEDEAYSADVVVSWPDPDDEFELDELALLDEDDDVVARIGRRGIRRALGGKSSGSAAARKLRVTGRRGDAYIALRATGLQDGRLRYKLRARKLRGKGKDRATTQISQSRRRR